MYHVGKEPTRDTSKQAVKSHKIITESEAKEGYFYTTDGKLLGNLGDDLRVLVVSNKDIKRTQLALSSKDMKDFKGIEAKELSIDHKILNSVALTAFGESQFSENAAWGVASSVFNKHKKLKESGFKVFEKWTLENTLVQMRNSLSDKKYLVHNVHAKLFHNEIYLKYKENAIAGIINADFGGVDYSNGGIGWQGKDIYGSNNWAENEGIFVPKTMAFFGETKENKNSNTLGFKYKFEGTAAFSAKDPLTNKTVKSATLFYKPTQEAILYFKKGYPNPNHNPYGGIAYPGSKPLKTE